MAFTAFWPLLVGQQKALKSWSERCLTFSTVDNNQVKITVAGPTLPNNLVASEQIVRLLGSYNLLNQASPFKLSLLTVRSDGQIINSTIMKI